MKTVSIKNKQFTLKYTLRAFFVFENITGYPFKLGKTLDEYILFYSMLLANNESFDLSFDRFIEACEESPTLYSEFANLTLREIEFQMQAKPVDESIKKKKKKK